WLIGLAGGGGGCVDLVERVTLPALRCALAVADVEARFLVHTDQPERALAALRGFKVETRPPAKFISHYRIMSDAHREALAAAQPGERIAFVNADMVPSVEVFAVAERRFV